MYYYKAIGKEREVEWDKVYEFVWLIKNTAMLYDGRKVCLEVKNYIEAHYPHYKEIISGFDDFYTYWEEGIVPDFIRNIIILPYQKKYTIFYYRCLSQENSLR